MRLINVVQLQGHLFFGNATLLAEEIEKLLSSRTASEEQQGQSPAPIRFLILDFTLVVAIDSSAAETVSKLFSICQRFGVGLCYSRGSADGFPCGFPLSQRLRAMVPEQGSGPFSEGEAAEGEGDGDVELSGGHRGRPCCEIQLCCSRCGASAFSTDTSSDGVEGRTRSPSSAQSTCLSCGEQRRHYYSNCLFLSDNLDEGLAWCEDMLLLDAALTSSPSFPSLTHASSSEPLPPIHLQQVHRLSGGGAGVTATLLRLFSFFETMDVQTGTVLWRQGDPSDRAVLLVRGRLQNELEDEAGTTESILPGHLVGEFGLLRDQLRQGTLRVSTASQLLVLTQQRFEEMEAKDSQAALLLAKISMVRPAVSSLSS